MWLGCRHAKQIYWGPDADGAYFSTTCFQQAAARTLGDMPENRLATLWLISHGWYQGIGGCYWFRTAKAANTHFEQFTKQTWSEK